MQARYVMLDEMHLVPLARWRLARRSETRRLLPVMLLLILLLLLLSELLVSEVRIIEGEFVIAATWPIAARKESTEQVVAARVLLRSGLLASGGAAGQRRRAQASVLRVELPAAGNKVCQASSSLLLLLSPLSGALVWRIYFGCQRGWLIIMQTTTTTAARARS